MDFCEYLATFRVVSFGLFETRGVVRLRKEEGESVKGRSGVEWKKMDGGLHGLNIMLGRDNALMSNIVHVNRAVDPVSCKIFLHSSFADNDKDRDSLFFCICRKERER